MSARRKFERQSLFALALLPVMMAASGAAAQDLPSGGGIQAGNVAFDSSVAGTLTINQTSSKAIINWTDFSIGAGNSVQFNNGTGATLNRVVGTAASDISGSLGATGSVYLINPNGVIVNSSGTVDVDGSFVGSTLNLTDTNFLNGGDLVFSGSSTAAVVNFGRIGASGGDIALIGYSVDNNNQANNFNQGQLTAANGTVGLLGGNRVIMRDALANDGKFLVEVGAGGSVTTSGTIAAAAIELRTHGGNIYAMAGNGNAFLNATGTQTINGRVFLTDTGGGSIEAATSLRAIPYGMASSSLVTSADSVVLTGSSVNASNWLVESTNFTINNDVANIFNNVFASGGDITVRTYDKAVYGPGEGFLTVSDGSLDLLGRNLTLSAYNSIFVDRSIAGTGQLVLRADQMGRGSGSVNLDALVGGNAVTAYTNFGDYAQYDAYAAALAGRTTAGSSTLALVNSYADLNRMGQSTTANYVLGRDIDASASTTTAYSVVDLASGVTFDGLGHSISNLTINRAGQDEVGLFSNVSGTIQNVNLVGASITGGGYTGALAAALYGGTVRGSSASGSVNGDYYVGGLVGYAQDSLIENSASSVAVVGTSGLVGGLLGSGNHSTINASSASGRVEGVGSVGGLAGLMDASRAGFADSVINSRASGDVVSSADYAGGLVGYLQYGSVSGSSAQGTVDGISYTGGLVGYSYASSLVDSHATGDVMGGNQVGGFVGASASQAIIQRSYATGNVSGQYEVGGLAGVLAETSLSDSSATGTVFGLEDVGGLIGLGNSDASIARSYAEGAVSSGANPYNVGGLIGAWLSVGSVSDSYATGSVIAANGRGVGGLVGIISGGQFTNVYATGSVMGAQFVGGLIGYGSQYTGPISVIDGYASGAVSSPGLYVGGIVGYIDGTPNLQNLYWDVETTGQSVGIATGYSGSSGLTTDDAFQLSNYVGFDLTKWVQLDGSTRPFLASEINGITTINNIHQLQLVALGGSTADYVIGRDFSAAQTVNNAGSVFGIRGFVSIDNGFAGTLDGRGHQITGLTIGDRGASDVGLFSVLNGTVRDLNLVGGAVVGSPIGINAGSVAGQLGSTGSIQDVRSSVNVSGVDANLGGLVGSSGHGMILRSAYSGALDGGAVVGGIVGRLEGGGLVQDSYFSGSAVNARDSVGGIVGLLLDAKLENVLSVGTLQSASASGAIAGYLSEDAIVTHARFSTDQTPRPAFGGFEPGAIFSDISGKTNAELTDATTLAAVYGPGFDFDTIWAPASGAGQTTGGAHFAELYRADNVLFVDGRGNRSVYGDTPGAISLTYRGLRDGDTVVRNATATTNATSTDNVGVYGLTISGGSAQRAGGGDYRVVRVGDLTVTQRAVTATLDGSVSRVYDATNTADLSGATLTVTGTVNGDVVGGTATTGVFDDKNVGTGKTVTSTGALTLTGTGASNYIVSGNASGAIGTITPATLGTVTLAAQGKVYDGTTAASIDGSNITVAGVLGSDDIGFDDADGTYNSKNVLGATTVTATGLTLNGADAGNYVLASDTATGTGSISARNLTTSLNSITKVYDGTTTANLTQANYGLNYFGQTGVIAGDDVTATNTSANYDTKNVAVTPTCIMGMCFPATAHNVSVNGITLTGADNANYSVSSSASGKVGQITARQLIAEVTGSTSRVYDGTTDAAIAGLGVSVANRIIAGDMVTAATTATSAAYADRNAGTGKQVQVGNVTIAGTDAANYAVANTAVGNVGTITPKSISAGLTGSVTRVYDGTTAAPVTGANYVFGTNDIVGSDTVTVTQTAAVFDGKDVASNIGVTASGLTLGGTDGGNYLLSNSTASANIGQINPRSVTATLTTPVVKVYDATTAATVTNANFTVSGLVTGETLSVSSGAAAYSTANAGTGLGVSVTGLALGGTGSANYVLTSNAAAANVGTITQRMLTAGLTGATTKVYDATTAATLAAGNYSLAGVLAGDTVALNNPTTGAYVDANAGTAKTISVNGLALTGASAGNYSVNGSASSAIGTITPRALTAGLTGSATKVYDATTAATLTGSNYSLSGVIAGDTVALNNPTVGSYADVNAGTAKTVSVTGLALSGASAGNYSVNASAAGAIGTINAKVLTAGLTGTTTRIYDGTTTAVLAGSNYSLSGVLAGDTVSLNNPATGAYGDRNVGTGKTVTATGLAIGGSSAGNYSLASTTTSGAIGAITPRGLTITADAREKNRNDADPALTSAITAGSLVTGDSLSGALSRAPGETVGAYAINQGTLSAGTNYAVTFNGATFTINLGIPPIDDSLFPINRPSNGTSGGGVVSGMAQTDSTGATPGLSFVEQASLEADGEGDAAGLDRTCVPNEDCPIAPYPSSGFTSASIRFEGYSR